VRLARIERSSPRIKQIHAFALEVIRDPRAPDFAHSLAASVESPSASVESMQAPYDSAYRPSSYPTHHGGSSIWLGEGSRRAKRSRIRSVGGQRYHPDLRSLLVSRAVAMEQRT